MTSFNISIQNMTCAGCAGRAECALNALDHTQAVVNLATHSASVDTSITPKELQQALQAAGYPAKIDKVMIQIADIQAGAQADALEREIIDHPSVTAASLNSVAQSIWVEFIAGTATPDEFLEIIEHAGFVGQVEQQGEIQPIRNMDFRRAIWAALLTLPVFVVEMGGHIYPPIHAFVHSRIGIDQWALMSFLLISAVMIWPGRAFYTIGLRSLLKGAPEMNSLVALGTLAAWGYSTCVVFAPDLLPSDQHFLYFEAAGVIITLILFGRFMESRAKGQAGAAIERLIGLQPQTAWIKTEDGFSETPIEQVQKDAIVRVKAGEKIPVDGAVIAGESYVDQAMITGEPMPIVRSVGDRVIAGTVNQDGTLDLKTTGVGSTAMLAGIVRLVQDAQATKLPVQKHLDVVIRIFVPTILFIVLGTFLGWRFLAPDAGVNSAIIAAVSVLIIACPCALGLATPTSILVGTGRAADLGVLFRRGDGLQLLADVKVIALDKTGTLTIGRPSVTSLYQTQEHASELASLQSRSTHPIAKAMEAMTRDSGAMPMEVQDFRAERGRGVMGTINDTIWRIGSAAMMSEAGITVPDVTGPKVASLIYMAKGHDVVGVYAVHDEIHPKALALITSLKQRGIEPVMITGDQNAAAQAVVDQLGISTFHAQTLPADKANLVKALQQSHGITAFLGDGVNDAPAMAQADVGIAIGTGSDIAIESSDVVLVGSDPAGILVAQKLAKATMANIKQNLIWAFGYNIVLIPVAAGVMVPFGFGMLNPMLAGAAMAISSICVVRNALRLRRV
jgi:heavy metal translocating P-type ATPase